MRNAMKKTICIYLFIKTRKILEEYFKVYKAEKVPRVF